MNALLSMTHDVRLFSRRDDRWIGPVDVVAPHNAAIHELLERWARWNLLRYEPATCASLEKLYLRGGRDATAPATAPQPPDPQIVAVDQAWRLMVRRVPQHAECIYLFYIARADGKAICRRLRLHWLDFSRFVGHARSMVSNIVKELEA